MPLARISIFLTILIYLIIGVWCLVAPIQTSSGVEISLPTTTAIIDFRATYGGLLLGIGIFFIICLKETYIRMGLILQALSLGGLAFGRVVGLILDGLPKPLLIYFLIAEIAGVVLAVFAFWRLDKKV